MLLLVVLAVPALLALVFSLRSFTLLAQEISGTIGDGWFTILFVIACLVFVALCVHFSRWSSSRRIGKFFGAD